MNSLPTKDQIRDWIRDNPGETSKRDIARAFGVKGADRIPLKAMIRELQADGDIVKERRSYRDRDGLPPVTVLRVLGPDEMGDLIALPAQWEGEEPAPRVLMRMRPGEPALGEGDRVLARLAPAEGDIAYTGRLIRRIGHGPRKVVGVFRKGEAGGRILPVDKKSQTEFRVAAGETGGARDGELVEAEQAGPRDRLGLPRARIVERLGDPSAARSVSLIAIHEHQIPDEFPPEALDEAARAEPVALGDREDLRHLPLITIDPADARDHDDAVCALAEGDGFILWVAIADVAHYVRPGTALDREARNRGNSTYFPDRVVPMLPEALSGDLCSLHEGADRPCIALEIRIDGAGTKTGHRFTRGLMRSPASLNYREVQAAEDGRADARTEPHLETIRTLFAGFRALWQARNRRNPLHLDLPERKVHLDEDGTVTAITYPDRLDAHRLIEEFMVLANVCAAETLEAKRRPVVYRVHEEPAPEKLESLRELADGAGYSLPKGQVLTTKALNRLLDAALGAEDAELVNMAVLRSMTQAYYAPENFGHFGLALRRYAHFTSPIRRYADLLVHRALIDAHGWGNDGLSPADEEHLADTADWISQTERRSMQAERDTTDRYLAAYLKDRVGTELPGRISGIARFGVFVKLDGTGADGLVPMGRLGDEYWHYDRDANTLMGDRSGRVIGLGQRVLVRLVEAEALTGGLLLDLLEVDGANMPPPSSRPARGKGSRRKQAKSRIKKAKGKRKERRR